MSFFKLTRAFRPAATRGFTSAVTAHSKRNSSYYRSLVCVTTLGIAAAYLSLKPNVLHLDAQIPLSGTEAAKDEETIVDPATSIAFPKVMHIPTNTGTPNLTLLGVGVRTVSFLGIKVYSVGFYADLSNPNLKIPADMSPEDKVKHIVKNTSCVIRIVPTRSTGYSHLRDAFVRALQSRLLAAIKEQLITEEVAQTASSPIRKLKGLFPNSSIAKHTPLDVFLSTPLPDKQRVLLFRDLGSVENDWVATELFLHYFEGAGPSPPLKHSVLQNLASYAS
ncbi:chalcone-flavanone isomerase-domain-containing protein [Crepidotus variabilis]|uniref:Chalcone-flavanone isomerase-domain-containing protein n=1 Tax=Crepidotus variabilis TaxID=179855 RepID=A0A9P6EV78_9AGAR|nr:chalcone-flavanone isomerase-domain-containing protein [Crepidotus variabilis]